MMKQSSDLDCSELKRKLNDIQQGVVVVLCERSEEVAALHNILLAAKRGRDRLITNDPGSDNTEFHRTDLGKLEIFEQIIFSIFSQLFISYFSLQDSVQNFKTLPQ